MMAVAACSSVLPISPAAGAKCTLSPITAPSAGPARMLLASSACPGATAKANSALGASVVSRLVTVLFKAACTGCPSAKAVTGAAPPSSTAAASPAALRRKRCRFCCFIPSFLSFTHKTRFIACRGGKPLPPRHSATVGCAAGSPEFSPGAGWRSAGRTNGCRPRCAGYRTKETPRPRPA